LAVGDGAYVLATVAFDGTLTMYQVLEQFNRCTLFAANLFSRAR
jgi:hypothetical protein